MASGAIVLKWCAGSGAMKPSTQNERNGAKGSCEVEGDREVIRRDVCRGDQAQSQWPHWDRRLRTWGCARASRCSPRRGHRRAAHQTTPDLVADGRSRWSASALIPPFCTRRHFASPPQDAPRLAHPRRRAAGTVH